MAEPLDIDDDPPSMSDKERREDKRLFQHRLSFMFGILFGILGVFTSRSSAAASAALFALGGIAWLFSGVCAILARRHMFASAPGGGWMFVRVRASDRSPLQAAIAGGILILLAVGMMNVAAQVLRCPPGLPPGS